MSLYETLDIPKKASPAEVKRAYRRKAKQHHPDKGGSGEDMSRVNHAYAVLSDETRRAAYDSTGTDTQSPSGDAAAHSLLAQIFAQGISSGQPDVVAFTRNYLLATVQGVRATVVQHTANVENLKRRRAEVEVAYGDNLFHSLIDQQVQQGMQHLASLSAQVQHMDKAIELLKAYSSKVTAPPTRYATFTSTTGHFR